MHRFETLDDVQSALQKLMQRDPVLVKMLPRQPGTKEARWAQLMGGDAVESVQSESPSVGTSSIGSERIARLEKEVSDLQREIAELREQLERFRRQFE